MISPSLTLLMIVYLGDILKRRRQSAASFIFHEVRIVLLFYRNLKRVLFMLKDIE